MPLRARTGQAGSSQQRPARSRVDEHLADGDLQTSHVAPSRTGTALAYNLRSHCAGEQLTSRVGLLIGICRA